MRIVKLSAGQSFIHASPLSLLIHRQAFNSSLMIDISEAFSLGEIINKSKAQKVFWTLSKTADLKLIDYEDWIHLLPDDNLWRIPVLKEINEKLNVKASEDESDEEIIETDNNWEISILVNAKRMGLSIEELNLLTMQSYIDYQDMYLGNKETKKQATQADIDRLLM